MPFETIIMNFTRRCIPFAAFMALILAWIPEGAVAEPLKVVYAHPQEGDIRAEYFLSVIRLSLEKSGVPFSMVPDSFDSMSHPRKMALVAQDKLSVIWMSASVKLEEKLWPIKIPIYGGINGYRIFIIRKETHKRLRQVKSLDDLRSFRVGFGLGWDGIDIFRNAGFVTAAAKYDNLFKMLEAGRYDLFSRGVQEAYGEMEQIRDQYPLLEVDHFVGVHHPMVVFLYTSKANKRLHNTIRKGLDISFADGSFKALFFNSPMIKSVIEKAEIHQRKWFQIANPFLSQEDLSACIPYLKQVSLIKIFKHEEDSK